jgi:hypothetical protein
MVYFNSINFYKQIRKRANVITVIDEATLVLDMDKLLAKHTTNEFQGI